MASRELRIGRHRLPASLNLPAGPLRGLVLFAHGSGSSRLSPRNRFVAAELNQRGLATLLFDLLTDAESADRANVFDIPLLAQRLGEALDWQAEFDELARLPVGLFGASTGAAAALVAAANAPDRIAAVVSRGGRPDLASEALARVRAPTLLIVGGADLEVLDLNRWAASLMACEHAVRRGPWRDAPLRGARCAGGGGGAGRRVVHAAHEGREPCVRTCACHSRTGSRPAARSARAWRVWGWPIRSCSRCRAAACPWAWRCAKALHAPLDLLLVRKIGVPWQPELAVGAVMDGGAPVIVVEPRVQAETGVDREYIEQRAAQELKEIERRRALYLAHRAPEPVAGRTAIVVDDGIATGTTVRAALRGLRQRKPARLVLAVPVAPPETVDALRAEVDDVVCLAQPVPFGAIGYFYLDFHQLTDDEVIELMRQASGIAVEERPAERCPTSPPRRC